MIALFQPNTLGVGGEGSKSLGGPTLNQERLKTFSSKERLANIPLPQGGGIQGRQAPQCRSLRAG